MHGYEYLLIRDFRVSPTLNRFVAAHSLRDSTEGHGFPHELLLPPTRNSLASEEVISRSKRVKNGIIILKEVIDSRLQAHR